MSSRSLRRGVVAALIIASAPVLAACSAGGTAASLQVKPNNVATAVSDNLKLNNVVVIADAAGDTNRPANLSVAISNTGASAETLNSVMVNGAPADLTKGGKKVADVTIPAGGSVALSAPGQVRAQVPNLTGVQLGSYTPVVFQFAQAGQVSVNASTTTGTGYYAPYAPTAAPASAPAKASAPASAPASPGGTAKPTGKATAGAKATTTAKATASPTH
ncbi:hypothetical protein [Phaeacidiphilus oryzae]|uniref:hypothetical protein n=1 Tax=Phaeacidiphilus oryzae TaxID=348818 RepID=UPI00055C680E|nr:hypothetical protein [Phaeacidiphilus oryzae]